MRTDIASIKSEMRSLEARIVKTERWCEEDSPEFHSRMETWINRYEGAEAEREKLARERHQQNIDRMDGIKEHNDRWNLAIAFIGVIIAACMLYLSIKSAMHAENDPAKMFHADAPQVYASGNQNADLPPTYQATK
jgi:hypothetical protein